MGPSSLRGDAGKRVPSRGRGGSRDTTHLPVDRQVPAGFGTAKEPAQARLRMLRIPSGCPGVVGPVPRPVSMDGAILPRLSTIVNRFIRMKRWSWRGARCRDRPASTQA
jgi:hypothetical protein